MILPLTERQARARGLSLAGHTAYAADGAAVGDYIAESGLVRLGVPDCSPRPALEGGYPLAIGGLPTSAAALALLTTRPDEWRRN